MKVGDAVRLRADSPLRAVLAAWADEVGRVTGTTQVDDDELRVAVRYQRPLAIEVASLWPEDLVVDRTRPDEPF